MHKSCEKPNIYAPFSHREGGGSIGRVFCDLTIVLGPNLWICEEYYHNGRYLYITEATQRERTPTALLADYPVLIFFLCMFTCKNPNVNTLSWAINYCLVSAETTWKCFHIKQCLNQVEMNHPDVKTQKSYSSPFTIQCLAGAREKDLFAIWHNAFHPRPLLNPPLTVQSFLTSTQCMQNPFLTLTPGDFGSPLCNCRTLVETRVGSKTSITHLPNLAPMLSWAPQPYRLYIYLAGVYMPLGAPGWG